MALFRKFFLKKTPDRLLEISERVYGMYNALVSRSSWACWVFDLRWSFTFRGGFFFLLGRGLDGFCSSASLWDMNCAAVCSALRSISVGLCN
jgi:hypothetical protein